MNNRMWNVSNPYQGDTKKVLCVCSAGLLRSPTAAVVLSQVPFNDNTRAVGIDKDHALISIDEVLISWADEIVVMTSGQLSKLNKLFDLTDKSVFCLDIPDEFSYRDPRLMDMIKLKYLEKTKIKIE